MMPVSPSTSSFPPFDEERNNGQPASVAAPQHHDIELPSISQKSIGIISTTTASYGDDHY
jgi:hypothetical protein